MMNRLAICEKDTLLCLSNQEIQRCRHSRTGIHEVMKINAQPITPWPARVTQLRDSANAGLKLLRAYDVAAISQARRSEVVVKRH